MTYRTEFPDFDPATLPSVPAEWTDQSWHNDTCPSFNTGTGTVVFIDFADKSLREFEDGPRFTVHSDPEVTDHNDVLFETDDWNEALAFVIAAKWVSRIGLGLHFDTSGKDYTPAMSAAEITEYDADVERLFSLVPDPYAVGVKAMERQQ